MNTTNITDHRFNKGHAKRQAQHLKNSTPSEKHKRRTRLSIDDQLALKQLKEELGITCEDMEKF